MEQSRCPLSDLEVESQVGGREGDTSTRSAPSSHLLTARLATMPNDLIAFPKSLPMSKLGSVGTLKYKPMICTARCYLL